MRDVSFLDVVWSREELRARIDRPERFRPEPRLIRPLPWRRLEGGAAEIMDPATQAWRPLHPAIVEVHLGLEAGEPFDRLVERAAPLLDKDLPDVLEQELRNYVLHLSEAGFVELAFEPAPSVFGRRYERVKELGRGGMGVVDLCRDLETGTPVVVKRAWGWTKPIERAEYTNRREARILRLLDHRAFPKLLDAFEVGGILHIVREFVDGPTLSAKVVPSSKERREVVAQLAEAIAHMHDRGLVYLDAKPGNFILGADGLVRVIDLGVARSLAELASKPSRKYGSPGFAAPEIRKSRAATQLSDQYSLGAVLFALATGGRPRRAWDESGIPQGLLSAGIDADEAVVIERMTRWDPSQRYPDMRAAAAALRG